MKKLLLFAILTFSLTYQAQKSFYKGALITELRTGFELYNVKLKVNQTTGNRNYDTSFTDKAANTYFGLGAEYGFHKYIGAGISFNSHKFINGTDSATGVKATTKANNILGVVNLHPYTTKKFDLVVGSDFGYSGFKLSANDSLDTQLKGKGFYVSGYINPRIYFGNFGIQFKLSTPLAKYSNVTTNNDDFNKNYKYKSLGFMAAWGIGFGIQYRFLKESGGTSSGASH